MTVRQVSLANVDHSLEAVFQQSNVELISGTAIAAQ
jgi:hypothetical protein